MSCEDIDEDESTLKPKELAGKREFDEIDLRYVMDTAHYEYEYVVSDLDHAEDELLEKSPNARDGQRANTF